MAKVLIVEDDKVLNQAYTMILKREGHTVKTAFDGKQALQIVKVFNPTIILLDLLMPEVSGLEFLKQYDHKSRPKTYVVILSNLGDEDAVKQAMRLGAYKYIVKAHSSPSELSVLVNHLISKNIEKKL